jgi:beta-glucanase (GH16 family)
MTMLRILTMIVATCLLAPAAVNSTSHMSAHHWKLNWSDEFNGPDDAAPDPAKWEIVTGGNGFGNKELEQYTARPENVRQEHGNLVITARRESFTGADGIQREYTSARLQTKGKFERQYGRFEARIKIPQGQGMWPAFWLLGNDDAKTGWPERGEIDVMENVGYEPGKIHGSMHGPGYSGGSPLTGAFSLPAPAKFADGFHVFAVEWDAAAIRFYVDDHLYETQTPDSVPSSRRWVFDHPFYILLNLAVGGQWPKYPDATTQFPQQMLVDYVRVYCDDYH